jgi:hypothetical protein
MPGPLPAMQIVAIEARAQISATHQHVHLDRSGRTIVEGYNRVLARDVEPGLADFVLHAREDVLNLVAEVRRLRDLLQDRA